MQMFYQILLEFPYTSEMKKERLSLKKKIIYFAWMFLWNQVEWSNIVCTF